MLKLYVVAREKMLALKEDISGATAIEYGLIAAGLSLAIMVGVAVAGPALNTIFTNIGTELSKATP